MSIYEAKYANSLHLDTWQAFSSYSTFYFRPAMFQVLRSHIYPVATILGGADVLQSGYFMERNLDLIVSGIGSHWWAESWGSCVCVYVCGDMV